jgi:hypothetical protein
LLNGVDHLRIIRGHGVHSVAALFNSARLTVRERKELVSSFPVETIGAAFGARCASQAGATQRAQLGPGPQLDVVVPNSDTGLVRAGLELRRALGPRGGALSIVSLDEGKRRARAGDFGLIVTVIQTSPPEMSASLFVTGGPRNMAGYSNPRVDAALAASDFALAEQQLAADPPAIVLCHLDRVAAVDARLTDAKLGDYDMLESLQDWQISR